MNTLKRLSLLFFIGCFLFLLIGVLTEEIKVGFFLIFPFFIGTGIFAALGVVFIFIAILFLIFGFFTTMSDYSDLELKDSSELNGKKKLKTGGIILIGPIPIVFGSNKKIVIVMLILLILFIILSLVTFRIF